jgi:hypothetical protein
MSITWIRRLSTASIGHYIEIKERVTLDFYIDDILLSDEFLVVPVDPKLATMRLMKCA